MNKKPSLQQELQANPNIIHSIPSPCYVLSANALESNLKLLNHIAKNSNTKILVALKGYSFWREFEHVRLYLDGATCSGVHEARLAFEEITKPLLTEHAKYSSIPLSNHASTFNYQPYALFYHLTKKEICVFSPAYKESQIKEILQYSTHIIFNSFAQWDKFKPLIDLKNEEIKQLFLQNVDNMQQEIPKIQVGLRINPLYSEVEPPIYNPCIPKSRLGITPNEFEKNLKYFAQKYNYNDCLQFFNDHFSGLHFHTHCEQDSYALERTLQHVNKHFHNYITISQWINFGGGHHITREDYDTTHLIKILQEFQIAYKNIKIILEPGEAVGWQTGDLIGEVVDIIENEGQVAILDISASCHMPDCLEMPYRPACYKITYNKDSNTTQIEEDLGEKEGLYRYRFGGPTCLAGDIIGDYSFQTPLHIGDKVAFKDMIHYTIVKNTTFNGVELPSLGVLKKNQFTLLKQFDYTHFKDRN